MSTDPYIEIDESELPEVYKPNWEKIENATDVEPFLEASVNLAVSTGQISFMITSLKPEQPFDRNQAILMGLLVRLSKLLKRLLRDISDREIYGQLDTVRQILETSATLRYLAEDDGSGDRFQAYVLNGLRAERETINKIKQNIKKRGGQELGIEKRMISSIQATALAAGVDDLGSVPGKDVIGFPNAETLIANLSETGYISYRMGSSEVHGTWTDLHKYHIEYDGKNYLPNPDQPQLQPQAIEAATHLIADSSLAALSLLYSKPIRDTFEPLLTEIIDTSETLLLHHEEFLENL